MTALFKAWESDKLAQLYLTTDVPDFTLCKRFYQINDFDMLKRLFDKQIQGREIKNFDLHDVESKKGVLQIIRF